MAASPFKGAPPIAADPSGFSDFWIFYKMLIFWNFPTGFGIWEGLQSIENGCGLQMDGFSAHSELYGFISNHFHDFGDFGIVSDGLTLFSEGLRTRECPEGPGTL